MSRAMAVEITGDLAGVAFSASDGRLLPLYESIRHHVPAARAILDIGCGDGALLHHLSKAHQGTKCIGIDVSPLNTGAAKSNIELICADYRMWQCDRQFDLVIATGVLHLLDMPDETLIDKLSAHIAPGGGLIYDLPTRALTNRLNAAARRGLRAIRSRYTDAAIKGVGRAVYGRSFDAEFITQRLDYLYIPPLRYEEQFGAELGRRGFGLVATMDAPRQSFVEMRARRTIRRAGGRQS